MSGSRWQGHFTSIHGYRHGADQPWVSASTIDADGNTITPGNLGNYHHEGIIPRIHEIPRLDINGDGDGYDLNFYEEDDPHSNVRRYRYFSSLTDNTYGNNSVYSVCTQNGRDYASASACPTANSAAPIEPIAPNAKYNGKANHLLNLPATLPRVIRSPTWVGASQNLPLEYPAWAVGTKHAMSLHDPWPALVDWRIRSADFNVMYYNQSIKYTPWENVDADPSGGHDLTVDANADFNAARSNPQYGEAGFTNTTNLASGDGFVYEVWEDDASSLPRSPYPKWMIGEQCNSGSGYHLTAADIAQSADGTGIVDPSTVDIDPISGAVINAGVKKVAGDRVCFTYSDKGDDGEVDLWDSHYRVEVRDNSVKVQKVRRTPHLSGEPMFVDNGVYPHNSHPTYRSNAAYNTIRVAMSDTRVLKTVTYNLGDNIPLDGFCENVLGTDNRTNPTRCLTVAEIKQNAANWYQYSRKRAFVAKGAVASLISDLPGLNYGVMGTSRSHTLDNKDDNPNVNLSSDISKLFQDVYDGAGSGNSNLDQTTHNLALQDALFSHTWRQSGTPLRQSLQRAGEYFAGRGPNVNGVDHSTSPIVESCQKNFVIMLTDGYWSGRDAHGIGNTDGDPWPETLADVAKTYYDEDLRPALDDDVPTDEFDTQNQQHLTTIGVGFGVSGLLVDDDGDGWPGTADVDGNSTYTETTDWGIPSTDPARIDDLWHAAYNSRGLYLSAKNPEELTDRLNDAILYATSAIGSASGVTSNSGRLSATSKIYQTTFQSSNWSGDVISYPIGAAGTLVDVLPEWSAQDKLSSRTAASRHIFTNNTDSNSMVPFEYSNLATTQKAELRKQWPNGAPVAEDASSISFAEDQIAHLRGAVDPAFRDRAGLKLGDIVHSDAVYVGPPTSPYYNLEVPGSYTTFRTNHIARTPVVYVGANDGMLHAFNAASDPLDANKGKELFAYIPSMLIPKLNSLTHKPTPLLGFSHRYFVDASPTSADAYFSNAWHSVLVGGLGAGGKGIYALDITNAPSNEEPILLWEFSVAEDVDMGYSFSKPSVVKLDDGNWYAIFGNGYDSTAGKAALYIVNIQTGLHKKIILEDVSTTNGLSTPTVIDTNGDMIADTVYAGDLLGNVWSYDLTSFNLNPTTVAGGTRLFTSEAGQPITQKIVIKEHPLGRSAGYLLYFGTGQFFRNLDNSTAGQATQSVYAIWDCKNAACSSIAQSDLLEQKIVAEESHLATSSDLRVTSDYDVTWLPLGTQVGTSGWESAIVSKGWYLDLIPPPYSDNHGERIASKFVLYGNHLIFSTLLPSDGFCQGGGSGWLMSLNAGTGGRFGESPFDINADGQFTNADFANWTDAAGASVSTASSGVKSKKGIPAIPLLIGHGGGGGLGSTGGAISISDNSFADATEVGVGAADQGNRQSWLQVE